MKKISEILLRRKNKVLLEHNPTQHEPGKIEKAMVLSIAKNVEAYGYTFSQDVIDKLLTYPQEEIKEFYADLMPKLKALVGADKEYYPMYPNFPEQVMEADDIDLICNAVVHYLTYGLWEPEYEKDERLPLLDTNKFVVLCSGSESELLNIFINLLSSKTSISDQDAADIGKIIETCPDYVSYLPNEIPLKENVALLGKLIVNNDHVKNVRYIRKYFKTPTDVLRFIVAISDGDVSLASKTKFKKMNRGERRIIMDLLAGCYNKNALEDMFHYQNEWIRVGEIIHPAEYKNSKYDKVNSCFRVLRANDRSVTFANFIQSAINRGDMEAAANLLVDRPGEFARQLDKIIRDARYKDYVIDKFASIAGKVSTPVLLQLRQHFLGRLNGDESIRIFFPKGKLATPKVIPKPLPKIDDEYCKQVIQICENALTSNFSGKESLGKVYISEDLNNYFVPFNQRSANGASKIVVRGSKLPIKQDAKTIRSFIWWTNTYRSRVDLDLSVGIFDKYWNFLTYVSYTNLRSAEFNIVQSGDIVNGGDPKGKGVAEFIDIDIDTTAEYGGRYIVFQVYSFTQQKFSELDNCRFGWMEREGLGSGEIFEPSTVQMNMDVTTRDVVCVPVIFDCVEKKAIWCDMGLDIGRIRGTYSNNLENNLTDVRATCYAMLNLNKPTIYDLVRLNAMARGTIVDDRNKADIIFDNDTSVPYTEVFLYNNETNEYEKKKIDRTDVPVITAFDADYFMGQMM